MKDFKKKSFSDRPARAFSKPRFGANKPKYGAGSKKVMQRDASSPVELFEATCAHCHKSCQVPFRPNGKKPVFCKECFATQGDAPQPRTFGRAPAGEKHAEDLQAQIERINSKLDTLTRMVKALAE